MDVHRGIGPLGRRGTGGGAEEAAEAASGGMGSEGRPEGADPAPAPPSCPTHNCQMVDFFFSWTDGCSRDALQGGAGMEPRWASVQLTGPHTTPPLGPSGLACPGPSQGGGVSGTGREWSIREELSLGVSVQIPRRSSSPAPTGPNPALAPCQVRADKQAPISPLQSSYETRGWGAHQPQSRHQGLLS